jgi:hypothetical protein
VSANESDRRVARRDKRILIETVTESSCFGCGHVLGRKALRWYRFKGRSHPLCFECEERLYEIALGLDVKMSRARRVFRKAKHIYLRTGAWPRPKALVTRKPRRRRRRSKTRKPGVLALEGLLNKPAVILAARDIME